MGPDLFAEKSPESALSTTLFRKRQLESALSRTSSGRGSSRARSHGPLPEEAARERALNDADRASSRPIAPQRRRPPRQPRPLRVPAEARVGRAAVEPRDERERLGQEVAVRPLREFRRRDDAAVRLVEVAEAPHEFVVLDERPVVA